MLVGRRSLGARAFPGALAFPGGKLEAQDAAWPGATGDPLQTSRYAALRETFEETGLLITASGDGPPCGAEIAVERPKVETGAVDFVQLLHRWDRTLDPDRLTPFARWVTPEHAPYRFDTFFFLVAASPYEAHAPLICEEFEQLSWERPDRLLEQEGRRLMTPTRHCLGLLQACLTVAEAVEAAGARGLVDGEQVRATRRG